MTGLIIGRFQPFHNGHLQVVRWIAEREQRIIIGIGSAQESHTMSDPFTAGERYAMIHETLKTEVARELFIVPMEDLNRNSLWVAHVLSLSPSFDRVYTNNPLVKELFEEYASGKEVVCPPIFKRKVLTGRKIRELMLEGKDWKSYVPAAVADVIERVDGVQRIRSIAGSDEVES
jgi:nicotinamide-nucleotide adenylyltransferase